MEPLMIKLYGIPNCDTVRKARKWLEAHQVAFQFINFRTDEFTEKNIQAWLKLADFSKIVNKRSQGWKSLTAEQQTDLMTNQNLSILVQTPTIIKRPVLVSDTQILFGFKKEDYEALLKLK